MPEITNNMNPGANATVQQKSPQDRMKEITDSIERGIQELFQSENYAQYLKTMARFHHYSVNNTMLIHMQNPEASLVAGFNAWRDKFKRHVKKGEKSIKIIAPAPYTVREQREKRDPKTDMVVVDDQGYPVLEEVSIQIPRYRVVPVFDVSQTEGEPIPTIVHDLQGHVEHFDAFYEAVLRSSPVPLDMEPLSANQEGDGYFNAMENRIVLREGMSEVQTISAAIHEITHAKLHNMEALELDQQQNPDAKPKTKAAKEVEAESVSYAVCQYFGIETSENSFGYIAEWSKGKELTELKTSLETINRTANEIIRDIDRNLAEIMSERGLQPVTEEISGDQQTALHEQSQLLIQSSLSALPTDRLMPCEKPTMKDLQDAGYTSNDLLPLDREKAALFFEQDIPVYAVLYGNARLILDLGEIEAHDGYFGVEPAEWKQSQDYLDQRASHDKLASALEEKFQTAGKDSTSVLIYQHRPNEADQYVLRYFPMEDVRRLGETVDRQNYEPVYLLSIGAPYQDREALLDAVYQKFNVDRPNDFYGHSLSVSDVVAVNMGGKITCHYVDTVGYEQLDGFLKTDNPLKNAEMVLEDDYGMIDGIINNGKNPALEDRQELIVAKQQPVRLPLKEQLKQAWEKQQQTAEKPHSPVRVSQMER